MEAPRLRAAFGALPRFDVDRFEPRVDLPHALERRFIASSRLRTRAW
jgi:hypothetical protein